MDANVPVTWLESSDPSYILYTSAPTGLKPRGVQRDTGGYAVATASMKRICTAAMQAKPSLYPTSAGWWVTATSAPR